MWIDFLNTNMCQIKWPEDANNIYIPQIGGYVSTDPLFIGWKTCTDSTADYIIYSLKVSETDISCVFSPLKYAMSNSNIILFKFRVLSVWRWNFSIGWSVWWL